MMWLLSLLGAGGLVAGLVFVPGAFPAVIAALSALLGLIRRNPWQCAVVVLCALSLWFLHGRSDARDELAAIHAAQKSAATAQVTVNHEPARKSGAIARTSDDEAPAYYASVSRAAADHAVRVPSGHSISRPDLPGADRSEQGVHGPSPAADLVCRPEADDAQIVTAAGRAAKMHQESLDLIASGVAVPSTEELR